MKLLSRLFTGGALCCLAALFCSPVSAGGIALGGTRVIFPAEASQTTLSVSNRTEASTYLIQSWVESAAGMKTSDFIVTPPLYTSSPGSENMLRIVSSGVAHPQDKESLYYLSVKAIPSVDKKIQEKEGGSLVVATAMQIKMFIRPAGLKPAREKAEKMLTFTRQGAELRIHNPTPYYLTLVNLKAGARALKDVMVSPNSDASVELPVGGNTVSWDSINDYGGLDHGQTPIRS